MRTGCASRTALWLCAHSCCCGRSSGSGDSRGTLAGMSMPSNRCLLLPMLRTCRSHSSVVANGATAVQVGWLLKPAGPSDDPLQRIQAVASLVSTVRAAVDGFPGPEFRTKQQACLRKDVSWDGPAQQWEQALLACLKLDKAVSKLPECSATS